jgi:prepilin-type N-terminal cleavage/methylation domain-containing protein
VPTNPSQLDLRPGRRAFTLVEILVAVAIVLLLVGLILFGGKAIRESSRRSAAQQQLALISKGIDQYAAFWPKWKIGGLVLSDQGWPDFIGGRLFDPAVFTTIVPFNNHLTYDVMGGIPWPRPINENQDYVGIGDVLGANVCLAYALTATAGRGPYLSPDDTTILKDVLDPGLMDAFNRTGDAAAIRLNPLLPGWLNSTISAARRAQVLVDPWGTPYRYFWVYRDAQAYSGFRPVPTALLTSPDLRTAEGFVLESAGPDKRFGNVWKASPTAVEIRDAADNLMVRP